MNVVNNFIHSSQILEQQMSIKRWRDKQIVIYPYKGILLGTEKEGTLTHNMDLKNMMQTIRSQIEEYTLYIST